MALEGFGVAVFLANKTLHWPLELMQNCTHGAESRQSGARNLCEETDLGGLEFW